MIINLYPVAPYEALEAHIDGDVITINGNAYDFSPLGKGQALPLGSIDSSWFTGPVTRLESGEIDLFLRLPIPDNASENMRFPESVMIQYGDVPLPQNETVEETYPFDVENYEVGND